MIQVELTAVHHHVQYKHIPQRSWHGWCACGWKYTNDRQSVLHGGRWHLAVSGCYTGDSFDVYDFNLEGVY